jgi:hypothetical protein
MATQLLVLPSINSSKLGRGQTAPLPVILSTMHIKLITIDYYPLQLKKKNPYSHKHHINSVSSAHFKTRRVVRKGSIYRTGVVLKTKTNLYFYRMWCGIYFQNYYSIPKSTQALYSCQTLLPRPRVIIT